MNERKLNKLATNSLKNRKEIEKTIDWIEANKANLEKYNHIKNLHAYKFFINFDEIQTNPITNESSPKYSTSILVKYAAILILVFLAGGFLFQPIINSVFVHQQNFHEILVPFGESAELILADQTHVWLNSGSKLIYSSDFGTGNRTVELSGEAFFDVYPDKSKPFIVKTDKIQIKVLGTNFNVKALPNSRTIDVTLVKGSVCLEKSSGEVISRLKPNQRAVFNKESQTLNISTVDTKLYTSWKEGILYFQDKTLEEIASNIESWFNIKIVFDDPALKNIKYTGAILKNKPIDQLLEILSYTANVDTDIEIKRLEPNVVHIKKKKPMRKNQ